MTRITFEHAAGPDEVYAPDAFRSQVGGPVPFRMEGFAPLTATLVAVAVSTDGRHAVITLDIPDLKPTAVLIPESDRRT